MFATAAVILGFVISFFSAIPICFGAQVFLFSEASERSPARLESMVAK